MKEVTEIIEIVFEKVQFFKTTEFLQDLITKSILKDYNIATNKGNVELNFQSKSELVKTLVTLGDSYYFNFLNIMIKSFEFSKMGVQIDKYDNNYDLNLHLDVKEIKKMSIISIMNWAEGLAIELDAKLFYCGYEPAIDKETRLFSGNKLGPVFKLIKLIEERESIFHIMKFKQFIMTFKHITI